MCSRTGLEFLEDVGGIIHIFKELTLKLGRLLQVKQLEYIIKYFMSALCQGIC